MNQMYNPAGIAWETVKVHDISDAGLVLQTGDNDEAGPFTLGELAGDIAAHLGLDGSPSAQAAVQELKSRLLDKGVDPDAADALTTRTSYKPKGFLQLIARARPELVHVFVVATGANAGTRDDFALDSLGTNRRDPPRRTVRRRPDRACARGRALLRSEAHARQGQPRERRRGPLRREHPSTPNGAPPARRSTCSPTTDSGSTSTSRSRAWTRFCPTTQRPSRRRPFSTFVDAMIDVYVQATLVYAKSMSGTFIDIADQPSPLATLRDRLESGAIQYWKVFGRSSPTRAASRTASTIP